MKILFVEGFFVFYGSIILAQYIWSFPSAFEVKRKAAQRRDFTNNVW